MSVVDKEMHGLLAAESALLSTSTALGYERRNRDSAYVSEVPPVFRVRLSCGNATEEEALLAFLRLDGVFAYAVGDGVEAVAVDAAGAEAPREMLSRVVDWLMENDAAITVALA
jgi:hypothetical protein